MTLQTLTLASNNVGDKGANALVRALRALFIGPDRFIKSSLLRNRAMHRAKNLQVATLLGVHERLNVFQQIRDSLKDGDEQYVEDDGEEADLFTRQPLYTVDIGVIILKYLTSYDINYYTE